MKTRPRILAGLLAATALAGATAQAAEVIEITTPATTRYYMVPSTTAETRTYYAITDPTPTYYYTPEPTVTEVIYEAPTITVEAPRPSEDQRITNDVVDTLASDPWLSGRIGVETRDQEVNLSGTVTTPGQVRRAVRGAQSVPGVRHVTSELRPKVGANTSY